MSLPNAAKNFKIGKKLVHLPDQVVSMLRPKANTPANFATFQVPLKFNKFDLRDYLLHAYNVQVLQVRSALKQQMPKMSQKYGRIYRPPPIKTMTVELKDPFVWPEKPDEAARRNWNAEDVELREKGMEQQEKRQKAAQKMQIPLRPDMGEDMGRKALVKKAKQLLGEGGWKNDRPLDPRFHTADKPTKKTAQDSVN